MENSQHVVAECWVADSTSHSPLDLLFSAPLASLHFSITMCQILVFAHILAQYLQKYIFMIQRNNDIETE